MTNSQYKRPPITEAVIEIRLENSLPKDVVDKIHGRLSQNYETSEELATLQFVFDRKKKEVQKGQEELQAFKLTSKDQADIVQIRPNSMICSRLAPYNGWENFEPRVRQNWDAWTKITKHQKINRLGVRYINRIDIPFGEGGRIDVQDYLTIFPQYPEPTLFKAFDNYTMQVVGPFSAEEFHLIINTNVVRSPLIDHVSIVLDIDLSPTGEIPQRDDKIWQVINQMREHKNNAFEMCITDLSRELFE